MIPIQAIIQALHTLGYETIPTSFYTHIQLWGQWYAGKVASFHSYRQFNGIRSVPRERASLSMAKHVAEDWANLELNEKFEIVLENTAANTRFQDILRGNRFFTRANRLVEQTFALGTGAFVEYTDDDAVVIDYVRAPMIFPLAWDDDTVTECAFGSVKRRDNADYMYLNLHTRDSGGRYIITNRVFALHGGTMTPADLPDGLAETVETHSATPRFQLIRPAIVNNVAPDVPMGVSVYANAIDQLKGCDLVYDSYCSEFRLGRRRIIVPLSMARMQMDADGITSPVFDDNDTEFYALPLGDAEQPKPIDLAPELRAQAHELALQTQLNLLSSKCGLGTGRYRFNDGVVKTATEVISAHSDLYQNLRRNETVVEDALQGLTRAVSELSGIPASPATVLFDDSIIEDTAAERTRDMQEVAAGLMRPWEYRVKWYGEDEKTARAAVSEGQTASLFEV